MAKPTADYLDKLLRELVEQIFGGDKARADAVLEVAGWDGGDGSAMVGISSRHGITIADLRSAAGDLQAAVDPEGEVSRRPEIASLYQVARARAQEVVDHVYNRTPISVDEIPSVLKRDGLTSVPFSFVGLHSVASSFGLDFPLEEFKRRESSDAVLITKELPADVNRTKLRGLLRQKVDCVGLASVRRLLLQRGADDPKWPQGSLPVEFHRGVTDGHLRDIALADLEASFIDHEWFWLPDRSEWRNRLLSQVRSMLCVCPRMPFDLLYDGIRRRFKRRGLTLDDELPPDLVRMFVRSHDSLELGDDDVARSRVKLDPKEILSGDEEKLVAILMRAPGRVLNRASLEEAVREAGISDANFLQLQVYSPLLQHHGRLLWGLRGFVPTEGELAKAAAKFRKNAPRRKRDQPLPGEGIEVDLRAQKVTLRRRLPDRNIGNLTVYIPKACEGIMGRKTPFTMPLFADHKKIGEASGNGAPGGVWGLRRFLLSEKAEPGDLLELVIDVKRNRADVRLERAGVPVA